MDSNPNEKAPISVARMVAGGDCTSTIRRAFMRAWLGKHPTRDLWFDRVDVFQT